MEQVIIVIVVLLYFSIGLGVAAFALRQVSDEVNPTAFFIFCNIFWPFILIGAAVYGILVRIYKQ